MMCLYCQNEIFGRSDKKFCNHHCKSAHQYEVKKVTESLYFKIDRQLKINRRILKEHNKLGLATVRKSDLIAKGFDPKYFTHYWKNGNNQVYLFCYEFGFLALKGAKEGKYLLVQHQDYMQ